MINRGYDGRIGNDNYYISDRNYQDYENKVYDANLVSVRGVRGYGQDYVAPKEEETTETTEKKFNWWLLIIGGTILYYMLKK